MSGMNTANSDHLIRSELWSTQLKEMLVDELMARQFVEELTEFPDGNTFNIPSIGSSTVRDYVENDDITYDAIDTGNFPFTITEYLSSGTFITDQAKQDAFYTAQLVAKFLPNQLRAIMERYEEDVFGLQSQQTAGGANVINGADHRFAGSGGTESIAVQDFAYALYALKKANVPQNNLVAIVDPSVEYVINTLSNLTDVSNNPRWEGIVADSIAQDMKFVKNVYGFDVYTSNRLANGITENNTSTYSAGNFSSGVTGVANLFFSAAEGVKPFVSAWRQQPNVESERNKDKQRDEYVTTARYGVKLYRPENFVTCITRQTV